MLPALIARIARFTYLVAFVACAAAADDLKQDDKPAQVGTWAKRDGETRVEFVDKQVMKIAPHGDPAVIAITCKYTIDKDRVVKAEVTEFEGKDEFKEQVKKILPIGTKFRFTLIIDKTTASIDNIEGDDAEPLKAHVEGKYDWKN